MQSRPVFYKSKSSLTRPGVIGLALLSMGLGLIVLSQNGAADTGCLLESFWNAIATSMQHPAHRFVGRDLLG
ncbi:MAG: hypothetical protein ACO24G_10140 [Burkholderiaceae bacterium]|jgi:hypothetical protein